MPSKLAALKLAAMVRLKAKAQSGPHTNAEKEKKKGRGAQRLKYLTSTCLSSILSCVCIASS